MKIRFYDIASFKSELERRGITEVRKEILLKEITAKSDLGNMPYTQSFLILTAADSADILEYWLLFDATISYALQGPSGKEPQQMKELREKAAKIERRALEKLEGCKVLPGVIVEETP